MVSWVILVALKQVKENKHSKSINMDSCWLKVVLRVIFFFFLFGRVVCFYFNVWFSPVGEKK